MGKVQATRDPSDTYVIVRHGFIDPVNGFIASDPTVGARFFGELQALGNLDGTVTIQNTRTASTEMASIPFGDFVDASDAPLGASEADVVNVLNGIFDGSGALAPPVVTSSLSITAVEGDSFNYELTGTGIAGIEWDSLPAGLAVGSDNRRNILGTAPAAGSYTLSGDAVNAFGATPFSIALTVSPPAFANTKSVNFNNNEYAGANAALLDPVLGRAGNGSGAADAWTVSVWFKAGTASNANQTILYFGAQDVVNQGQFQLKWNGNATTGGLVIRYGSSNNRLDLATAVGANPITVGVWHHLLFVYDGGTTGAASGSVSSYYSRFSLYVDGVAVSLVGSNSNFGFTGGISGQNFRIGRWNNGQTLRNNTRVDEVAIWGSDQSANVATIYNGGVTQDLSLLGTPPDHWWRMGDGDTFPILQDNIGSAHFQMYNMVASDIVNDAP